MPRYLFAVRHPAYAELEDDVCGMELPDHAAAACMEGGNNRFRQYPEYPAG